MLANYDDDEKAADALTEESSWETVQLADDDDDNNAGNWIVSSFSRPLIMVQSSSFSSIQINVNQTEAGRKNSLAPFLWNEN